MSANNAIVEKIGPRRIMGVSRRQFLRGLGACMALPAFESIRPLGLAVAETGESANLATSATGAPVRTAFIYFPNGAIQSSWWPEGEGTGFEFSPTLKPLEKHRDLIQVMGGLDHRNAEAGPDGAGDHARANGTFLTGVRMKKSAADIHAGVSIDQAFAQEVGKLTRFSSLEMTCDFERPSGACDSGYSCAYQFNLAWSSPTTPLAPEHNPRLIFERLFGSGSSSERAENFKRRQLERRSILDFVLEDARGMQQRLSARDREKLDQYLTGIRDIETRIQRAEKFVDVKDPGIETPTGIPTGYSDYLQLMFDLLVVAFQTDTTRIATFLLAHDGSNRSFAEIGVSEGHHDLSHHFDNQEKIKKVAAIDLYYAQQFAQFLDKLRNTKDSDGTSLLHNSMIVYGGGNADGNRHTHTNLPVILAGAGGGQLQTGRFVKHGSKPMTNLFLGMGQVLGLQNLDRFGDSTGILANI